MEPTHVVIAELVEILRRALPCQLILVAPFLKALLNVLKVVQSCVVVKYHVSLLT